MNADNSAALAAEMRRRADDILIQSSHHANSGRKFHLPDGDGTQSLCNHLDATNKREPIRKPVDAYPPGWHAWCIFCVAEAFGLNVAELRGMEIVAKPAADGGGERA